MLARREKLRRLIALLAMLAPTFAGPPGCKMSSSNFHLSGEGELDHYKQVATELDYPDVKTPANSQAASIPSPLVVSSDTTPVYWDMKLEEAIQTALARSKVLTDLGGVVLKNPGAVRSIHGPAITETDPRFGVEAALSAFDATLSGRAFFTENDRALNNVFFGGGTRLLDQDLHTYQTQIQKRTAAGTLLSIRNNTDWDANNSPGNQFFSAWNVNYEVEARQSLLQGGGVNFNRIAGPNGIPGFMNGVLIARVNTDISLTEFEIGLRDLVSNVENTYWDLYFAYRDLDAKMAARDSALDTWRRIQASYMTGRRGGEAEKEAEAREQYFRFQEDVQNALSGRLFDGTRTNNGSSGGTARGLGGVRVVERRLRLLIGLPITDDRLIRPADEPKLAKVVFDWDVMLPESLARHTELRRQRWIIKRREMELVASKNFLLPTLDTVALYRFRGFGDQLLNPERQPGRFDNAYQDLTTGDFQEWQLGAEFSMPLGLRRGHAAVRNAQLQLSRERAILEQQEREVAHDVSNALADVNRAYEVAQTNFNRRIAARQHVAAVQAAYDAERAPLDLLLEAQRRLAEAETRFFAVLVEYAVAVKNVHYEKGSLLDYNEIYMSEGPWPGKAYDDAASRAARTHDSGPLSYIFSRQQPPVSRGPVPQGTMSQDAAACDVAAPGAAAPNAVQREAVPPGQMQPQFPPVSPETIQPLPLDGQQLPRVPETLPTPIEKEARLPAAPSAGRRAAPGMIPQPRQAQPSPITAAAEPNLKPVSSSPVVPASMHELRNEPLRQPLTGGMPPQGFAPPQVLTPPPGFNAPPAARSPLNQPAGVLPPERFVAPAMTPGASSLPLPPQVAPPPLRQQGYGPPPALPQPASPQAAAPSTLPPRQTFMPDPPPFRNGGQPLEITAAPLPAAQPRPLTEATDAPPDNRGPQSQVVEPAPQHFMPRTYVPPF